MYEIHLSRMRFLKWTVYLGRRGTPMVHEVRYHLCMTYPYMHGDLHNNRHGEYVRRLEPLPCNAHSQQQSAAQTSDTTHVHADTKHRHIECEVSPTHVDTAPEGGRAHTLPKVEFSFGHGTTGGVRRGVEDRGRGFFV